MARYVVTGTDTGVGKTVFAAALAGHMRARYWKPVQAGLDAESDSEAVGRLSGGRAQVLPEAYRLSTPCSPHEAARRDGIRIAAAALALPPGDAPLVPLSDDLLAADLFARWGLPVIVVARTALGTINHTLLSLEALRSRGVHVHGVAFVGEGNPASEAAIVSFGATVHLGRLPPIAPLDADRLAAAFAAGIRTDLL
jgi:dethiobiotin synthetase